MESRTDIAKKAFLEAYSGIDMAFAELKGDDFIPPETIGKIAAPIAAEIYRQMTSVIVITIGSKEHRARSSDMEVLKGVNSPYLLGSHDLNFYSTNVDNIELIIQRLMEDDDDGKQ